MMTTLFLTYPAKVFEGKTFTLVTIEVEETHKSVNYSTQGFVYVFEEAGEVLFYQT